MATTDFQHSHSGWNQELVELGKPPAVIVSDDGNIVETFGCFVPILPAVLDIVGLLQSAAIFRRSGGDVHVSSIGYFNFGVVHSMTR